MHTQLKIEKVTLQRNERFLRHFLLFTMVALGTCALMLILAIGSVFSETLRAILSVVAVYFQWFGGACGYITAEMFRHKTVNPDTEDLRPYSWRELFQNLKRT